MSPSEFYENKNKALLCIVSVLTLVAMLISQTVNAEEKDELSKFYAVERDNAYQYKFDHSVDEQRNIRIIELLQQYARKYIPIAVSEKTTTMFHFTAGAKSWYISYGLQHYVSDYETNLSFYASQVRNDLTDYQLWIQKYDANTASINTIATYNDLKYTLTSAGLSGALYYLHSKQNTIAIGLELALLGVSRLNIESIKADKSYVSNGVSLLGYPVWRHTNLIPLKIRYKPLKNVALEIAIHYSHYSINQETTNAETEGEWLNGCNKSTCSKSEIFPSLGIQIFF